jgi:hypothetical protein
MSHLRSTTTGEPLAGLAALAFTGEPLVWGPGPQARDSRKVLRTFRD